jgi:hypothetical protein
MFYNMKKLLFLCLSFFFVWGCMSNVNSSGKSSEDSVNRLSQTASTFMQAMVDKNWDLAYSFFDSGFKQGVPIISFTNYPRQMEIKAFTIKSVEILPSGKEANVVVTEDISQKGFTFKGLEKTQRWIVEKRKWVLVEGPPASIPESKK